MSIINIGSCSATPRSTSMSSSASTPVPDEDYSTESHCGYPDTLYWDVIKKIYIIVCEVKDINSLLKTKHRNKWWVHFPRLIFKNKTNCETVHHNFTTSSIWVPQTLGTLSTGVCLRTLRCMYNYHIFRHQNLILLRPRRIFNPTPLGLL